MRSLGGSKSGSLRHGKGVAHAFARARLKKCFGYGSTPVPSWRDRAGPVCFGSNPARDRACVSNRRVPPPAVPNSAFRPTSDPLDKISPLARPVGVGDGRGERQAETAAVALARLGWAKETKASGR